MPNTLDIEQQLTLFEVINHINLYTANKRSDPTNSLTRIERKGYIVTGYAGSGKTLLISLLVDFLNKSGLYGKIIAFTGRAASNLTKKGIKAHTCHSIFYEPELDENGDLIRFRKKKKDDIIDDIGGYLIVEEASMMPLGMIEEALAIDVPVIFVGDPAQLPTIEGDSIFTVKSDEYEKYGRGRLETIHRQGSDSNIIALASSIRQGRNGQPDFSIEGNGVSYVDKKSLDLKFFKSNPHIDVVVCGTNRTRRKLNTVIRASKGFQGEIPEVGERVICNKNTVANDTYIANGELFDVVMVFPNKNSVKLQVRSIDNPNKVVSVEVDNDMFLCEQRSPKNLSNDKLVDFVFAYAVTCHRLQGSEVDHLLFVDENVSFFLDQKKYRYTGVTRAAKSIMYAH